MGSDKKESGGSRGRSLPVDWLKNQREKAVAEKLRGEFMEAALRAAAVEELKGESRRAAWEDYARAVFRLNLFWRFAWERERGNGNRFETFFENIEKGRKTETGDAWGVEFAEDFEKIVWAFSSLFAGVKFGNVLNAAQNVSAAAGFEPFEDPLNLPAGGQNLTN